MMFTVRVGVVGVAMVICALAWTQEAACNSVRRAQRRVDVDPLDSVIKSVEDLAKSLDSESAAAADTKMARDSREEVINMVLDSNYENNMALDSEDENKMALDSDDENKMALDSIGGNKMALDFSWLFACPECNFIANLGMNNKPQPVQQEL